MSDGEIILVNVGDTIQVGGHRFILVRASVYMDKPAEVEFRQPIELAER